MPGSAGVPPALSVRRWRPVRRSLLVNAESGWARRVNIGLGQVAERLKAHAWNACIPARVSRVRIPLCPPIFFANFAQSFCGNICPRNCPIFPDETTLLPRIFHANSGKLPGLARLMLRWPISQCRLGTQALGATCVHSLTSTANPRRQSTALSLRQPRLGGGDHGVVARIIAA